MLKSVSLMAVVVILSGCAGGGGGRPGATVPAPAPAAAAAATVPATLPVACTLFVDVVGGTSGGRIRITFTNCGAAAVPVAWQDVLQTYAVTVADAGGREVPLTRYGVGSFRDAEMGLGPHATDTLGPGGSEVVYVPLKSLFDISEPGGYRVTVRRRTAAGSPVGAGLTATTAFRVAEPDWRPPAPAAP